MVILIAFATFISKFLGGLFALRFKDKLHLVLGFSAGAVIGVAFFDLMPEAIELGEGFYQPSTILHFTAIGFLCYLILDRMVFFHAHQGAHEESDNAHESHASRGILGASSFTLHSFLDGIIMGLAFQVSSSVGSIVAIAIFVHGFSDGINTVNMVLKNEGGVRFAFKWLLAVALAPVLGVFCTFFFTLPGEILALMLAIFSGSFLYIGATDLIPESHHAHPKFITTAMTIIGVFVIYLTVLLAHG